MKNCIILAYLASILSLQSCKQDSSSDTTSTDTGGNTITVPNAYGKSWIRGTGTTATCETGYDTDGDGTSTSTESQTSYFTAGTSAEGSTVVYYWSAFYNTNSCYFDGPEEKIIDRVKFRINSESDKTASTVTYKTTVTTLERMVKGSSILTAINAYSSNSGGCGKSDWISDQNYQYATFSSGCRNTTSSSNENAFHDFKFSTLNIGEVVYWKLTLNGSDLNVQSSTDGVNFDTVTSYYAP